MAEYIFGTGQLFATPVGGGAPLRFGALQDVSVDFQGDTKELFGQYQFPLAVARGKTKVTWQANTANIDVAAYNQVFFGGTVVAGTELKQVFNEAHSVPASGQYTVTVANYAEFFQDLGVYYSTTGLPLQQVGSGSEATGKYSVSATGVYTFHSSDASAALLFNYLYEDTTKISVVDEAHTTPGTSTYTVTVTHNGAIVDGGVKYSSTGVSLTKVTAGQEALGSYSVDETTGIYTFHADDKSKAMLFSYSYTGAGPAGGSLTISNQLMGTTPYFRLILSQYYDSKTFTLVLYKCVADKLNMPLKLDDFMVSQLSGNAQVDDLNRIGRITTTSAVGGGA